MGNNGLFNFEDLASEQRTLPLQWDSETWGPCPWNPDDPPELTIAPHRFTAGLDHEIWEQLKAKQLSDGEFLRRLIAAGVIVAWPFSATRADQAAGQPLPVSADVLDTLPKVVEHSLARTLFAEGGYFQDFLFRPSGKPSGNGAHAPTSTPARPKRTRGNLRRSPAALGASPGN